MTPLMITIEIALFVVLMGFTWYRLEAFNVTERMIICGIGILISIGITNILFSISTNGINYTNVVLEQQIRKMLITVFTPINGIILMPFSAKIVSDIKFQAIDKNEATKRIILLTTIIILVFVIEIIYLKNIQLGIFDIANGK